MSSRTRQERLAKKRAQRAERAKARVAEVVEQQYSAIEEKLAPLAEERQIELRRNVPGQEKMSEVLLDFLRPYLDDAKTRADIEKLVAVGIFAWNAAISSKGFEEGMKLFTDKLSLPDRIFFKKFVRELMARKEALFPENKRLIISYRVADLDDQWHVSVASTLAPDANPD